MDRTELKSWAEQEMQRTFDGKRWKFSRAAANIANKGYSEGFDAGFALAVEIANAPFRDYINAFRKWGMEDDIDPIVDMQNITGRDAAQKWERYLERKAEEPDYEHKPYTIGEAIDDLPWYHINDNGKLVEGARSDMEALYKAEDVLAILKEAKEQGW